MTEFGEQLKKAREAKGITQQTLAEKLFVTRQTISRWENGNRFPDILTTKRIAELLDISVGELIAGEKPQTIIERNPVIENPVINSFTIVLYAGIVIIYIISVISALIKIQSILNTSPADALIIGIRIFCLLSGIVIFIAGLFFAVKGNLSSKKTGFIVCAYWITCFCIDISNLFSAVNGNAILIIGLSTVSVIGVTMAYLFYFRKISAAYCRIMLYVISAWGMIRAAHPLIVFIFKFSGSYALTEIVLSAVLSICIHIMFIYQTYTLNRKRRLVNSMAESLQ